MLDMTVGAARLLEARGRGMIGRQMPMQVRGMAIEAGLVAHALEGFGMAGLAVLLERRVRRVQRAGAPVRIGRPACGPRQHQRAEQRHEEETPRPRALAPPGGSQSQRRRGGLGVALRLRRGVLDRQPQLTGDRRLTDRDAQRTEQHHITGREAGIAHRLVVDGRLRGRLAAQREAVAARPDLRMLQLHAWIVHLQQLIGRTADAHEAVVERSLAYRERIACAAGDLTDQDAHRRLTSRGTRWSRAR